MYSLARGLPPLDPSWIRECVAARTILPANTYTVRIKDAEGVAHRYPGPWVRSLKDRRFVHPLPYQQRILHGVSVGVICSNENSSMDVSIVARECGARVWKLSDGRRNSQRTAAWKEMTSAADDHMHASQHAAESASPSQMRSSRRLQQRSTPPVLDMILTDSSSCLPSDLTSSLRSAVNPSTPSGSMLSVTSRRLVSSSSSPSSPPILSVKWLIQCLMMQKRVEVSEEWLIEPEGS